MIIVVGSFVVISCCVLGSEFFAVVVGSVVVATYVDSVVNVDVSGPVVFDVIAGDGSDENCVAASEDAATVVKTKQYLQTLVLLSHTFSQKATNTSKAP